MESSAGNEPARSPMLLADAVMQAAQLNDGNRSCGLLVAGLGCTPHQAQGVVETFALLEWIERAADPESLTVTPARAS
jgi:hypothetical protein